MTTTTLTILYVILFFVAIATILWCIKQDQGYLTVGDVVLAVITGLLPIANILIALMFVGIHFSWGERIVSLFKTRIY